MPYSDLELKKMQIIICSFFDVGENFSLQDLDVFCHVYEQKFISICEWIISSESITNNKPSSLQSTNISRIYF